MVREDVLTLHSDIPAPEEVKLFDIYTNCFINKKFFIKDIHVMIFEIHPQIKVAILTLENEIFKKNLNYQEHSQN